MENEPNLPPVEESKEWPQQLRDKLEACGISASDAVYLEAALNGGEENLNYPDVAERLREVFKEAGWHPLKGNTP